MAAQRRVSLELKVGTFIVAGIILLGFFLFTIGDLDSYFQPGYTFRVRFASANGIGQGSPVQYAGVEVGKVQSVQIVREPGETPQVEIIARVPESVPVKTDDSAAISTFGLLGEKYLEITPGPGEGAVVKPSDMLRGKPPVSTDLIIERSNEVLTELKQTLAGLNSLVGDPQARIYLSETLQEARDAMRNWRLLGERMNLAVSHVEAGEGSLGKLLFDDELYRQTLAFLEDLRQHPWKLLVRPKQEKSSTHKSEP